MKKSIAVLVALASLLFAFPQLSFAKEVRHRAFSTKEIQEMARTKAVIHTKFGNMTLKFFPEAAPNHVNNFIELAKKGF